ncbi:BatD family protein, partial [Thermodesulfobacteriota bacterium]
ILVPLKTGEQTIEPAVLQCDVVRRRQGRRGSFNSFFNDPFFGHTELSPRLFRTDSIAMNVKSLPPFNGPGKFSGLVGAFDLKVELAADKMKVGDSTTLTVSISGNGNIMDAQAPEILIPGAFKSYTDAPEENVRLGSSGYSGDKSFRTALVPIKTGAYTIKPIHFSYFDPSEGEYVTRNTQPISLTITPADKADTLEVFSAPSETDQLPKPLKKKVEFTGRDILPLKEDLGALTDKGPLSFWLLILFLGAPFVLYIGVKAFFVITRKDDLPAKIMADRAEKALKAAGKDSSSGEDFFFNLHRALVSIILSKAGVKGESLTYAEAVDILRTNGYPDETADRAAALLERIDSYRYSGLQTDEAFKTDLFNETKQLVRNLSR